jgi:type IV pilus assembly protein PilM
MGRSLLHSLGKAFPTPPLLLPRAGGVDISDSSIKWLAFSERGGVRRVQTYGEIALDPGIVVSGAVQDVKGLATALKEVKKELGSISCAHAALPEELAYVFGMHIPYGTSRDQALKMIEFEFEDRVPIPPSAAVYDYNPLAQDGLVSDEVAVVVFPRDVAEAYVAAFEAANITLLSLEIEARSIARAVSSGKPDEPITLLVDFGRARTGFAVLKYGLPIFTSTVGVGGEVMTQTLIQRLSMTPEEAELFKNEQGLLSGQGQNAEGIEIVSGTASALSDEVLRHYRYWDTRRNEHGERMTPVGRVLLVGGSCNLKGLPDYIAGRVQAPTERGEVWRHVASYDDYIPPIDRQHSLQYATAIGLALRGMAPQTNL